MDKSICDSMSDQCIDILLVEDDEVDIMNVRRAFVKNNITNTLYIARNGLEALQMLRGETDDTIPERLPRIILLDLNMPKMGGIEFLRELRKDRYFKSMSVFVMTTSNEESDKLEAFDLNVAGYIVKPLSFERFVQAISILKSYWMLCECPKTHG
jgi:CheY-like chemotaxis protein